MVKFLAQILAWFNQSLYAPLCKQNATLYSLKSEKERPSASITKET